MLSLRTETLGDLPSCATLLCWKVQFLPILTRLQESNYEGRMSEAMKSMSYLKQHCKGFNNGMYHINNCFPTRERMMAYPVVYKALFLVSHIFHLLTPVLC